MRCWRVFARAGKRHLRSGLRITSTLRLCTDIAEIDRGHHHESLYWADHDRERAKELKAQILTSDDRGGKS